MDEATSTSTHRIERTRSLVHYGKSKLDEALIGDDIHKLVWHDHLLANR